MVAKIKLVLVAFFVGFLISRGGSENQSWILVLLGLFIWVRLLVRYSPRDAIAATFLIWLVASLFMLDWLEILGFDAKLALCVFVAFYWAISIGVWIKYLKNRASFPSLILALHIVASEYILSIAPFGGFNWLRISYLLSDIPFAGMTYWLGVSAIAFIVIFSLHKIVIAKNRIFTTGLLITVFTTAQVLSFTTLPGGKDVANTNLKVLGIQGGVPEVGLDFNAQRAAVFTNHLNRTNNELRFLDLQNETVDLVLWPENSSDIDPFRNSGLREGLKRTSVSFATPILFGAVLQSNDGLQNAAVLASGNNLTVEYIKQKLVPFGEYLPFRSLLAPFIKRFDRLATDFQPGTSFQSIQIGQTRVGVLICYEVAFDQLWSQARKESDIIVVMTNNATYGGTTQPLQQLRITQMQARAIKIPVLIVSTSGVSAYINEHGKIVDYIARNEPASINQSIPHMKKISPATLIGVPLQIVSLLLIIALIFTESFAIRKKRTRVLNQHHP
jgi:apolipoprotein N-acyltransferase